MMEPNKPDKMIEPGTPVVDEKYCIVVNKDGPLCVYGNPDLNIEVITPDEKGEVVAYTPGRSFPMDNDPTILCRCGYSKNKPYCDGEHLNEKWDADLTASMKPLLEKAEVFDGPGRYQMYDNPEFCVHARFCMAKDTAWRAVRHGDDPEREMILKKEVFLCPSGRLKLYDKKENKFVEPDLKPSLSLLEDPQKNCSGPLWVKGGIPIEDSSGNKYEIRNRVTLCRCGRSKNKPYCDGAHMAGFKDGLL